MTVGKIILLLRTQTDTKRLLIGICFFSLMPLFVLGTLLWRSLLFHQIQGPDPHIALKAHVEIATGDVEKS